jgi:hypothetical protein
MKKQINHGEVYFDSERDFRTGQVSDVLKIGISQNGRTSEDRLKDHQTGNSKQIVIESKIDNVPDALLLEQQLHVYLTLRRLHGEWFVLSVEERALVEAYGLMLKDQIQTRIELNEKCVELSEIPDNGLSREASPRELQILERLQVLEERVKLSAAISSICKSELTRLAGLGTGIERILSIDPKSEASVFDKARFKLENPELYDAFIMEKPAKWESKFSTQTKVSLKNISSDLANILKELPKNPHLGRTISPKIERSERTMLLHEEYLKHEREIKLANWEIEVLEAQLQIEMGEFNEIIGVATWKRHLKPSKEEFSASALKNKYPELYERYLIHKPHGWNNEVEKFRPYSFELGEISFESIYDQSSMDELINNCITLKTTINE